MSNSIPWAQSFRLRLFINIKAFPFIDRSDPGGDKFFGINLSTVGLRAILKKCPATEDKKFLL
ncbi:hypothetical protein DSUL_90003 [Desulfovibrionales bacterium]